jgi:hypothetical protein
MEISNEIKAKVFAQYLGQRFVNGAGHEDALRSIDGEEFRINRLQHNGKLCKLILRPLSEITDRDAIELGLQLSGRTTAIESLSDAFYRTVGREFVLCDFKGREIVMPSGAYQYLQSRGYDLPHYLLNGKTLHESGLCIYESK